MLYQLSYLGIRPLHRLKKVAAHTICHWTDQAASGGDTGGSSSDLAGGPGMRYWPVSQRPRSTSAQRLLQNGLVASVAGLPQTGQFTARLASRMFLLDDPFCRTQRRIGTQDQGTPCPSRKVRQRIGVRL
jgi:hypothetical protein